MSYLKKSTLLFLVLLVSLTLTSCNKPNYTDEEVIEFVHERYGNSFECTQKTGNLYTFTGIKGNTLSTISFKVRQERGHHMFDATPVGGYPILVSNYQELIFKDSKEELDSFIKENNLVVTEESNNSSYSFKMYKEYNSEAEYRGLVNYIEDILDNVEFGETNYEFRESISIWVDYYEGDDGLIFKHISIL